MEPFLIINSEDPVGFLLLHIDLEADEFDISRLMIDQNHQSNGYGRKAMILAIEYLKNKVDKKIELSHLSDNPHPLKLYQSLGFRYTGVVDEGEMMMELVL